MGKRGPAKIVKRASASELVRKDFDHVLTLIDAARTHALGAVNTALIDLYWSIGELIARRIADEGWGKGTVQQLSTFIHRHHPNARGFSPSNLWRMMQFYEVYCAQSKLAPLVRELGTNKGDANLYIEKSGFYLLHPCSASLEKLQADWKPPLLRRAVRLPKMAEPVGDRRNPVLRPWDLCCSARRSAIGFRRRGGDIRTRRICL